MPIKDSESPMKNDNRQSILATLTRTITGTLKRKKKKTFENKTVSHEEVEAIAYKPLDSAETQLETKAFNSVITPAVSEHIKIELLMPDKVMEASIPIEIDTQQLINSQLRMSLRSLITAYTLNKLGIKHGSLDMEKVNFSSELNFNLVMPNKSQHLLGENYFEDLKSIVDFLTIDNVTELDKFIEKKLSYEELPAGLPGINFLRIEKFLLEIESKVCNILEDSEYSEFLKKNTTSKKLEISESLMEISRLLVDSSANHEYEEISFESNNDYESVDGGNYGGVSTEQNLQIYETMRKLYENLPSETESSSSAEAFELSNNPHYMKMNGNSNGFYKKQPINDVANREEREIYNNSFSPN